VNGPRDSRWSVHSRVSIERIVAGIDEFGEGDTSATVCPVDEDAGRMMFHVLGMSESPVGFIHYSYGELIRIELTSIRESNRPTALPASNFH
jgi:hypothetical protein